MTNAPTCRSCGQPLGFLFLDLGKQPSANSLISPANADTPETQYPLSVMVCDVCLLVQLSEAHAADEIFNDGYVYYASYSRNWVDHAKAYVEMAADRFELDARSFIVEVGSNDGYLLQHAVNRGIPCLGIDPARGCAEAASEKGVETLVSFFNEETASQVIRTHGQADLICGNNVVAHVPAINDFVAGLKALLKHDGILTLEFPHLQNLIANCQFDTIYDEHYFYYSLVAMQNVLARHGLKLFDVERLPTHGGSLRIFACHENCRRFDATPQLDAVFEAERAAGLHDLNGYAGFQNRVDTVLKNFKSFLMEERAAGRIVCGFGAAAKGNTFLNAATATPDTLAFVCDDTPAKQGRLLPGSRIPVVPAATLYDRQPDTIVILPWNVAPEIIKRNARVFGWGGKFATFIPHARIYDSLSDAP